VITGIVWLRQDLRLADNPALRAACDSCDVVVPIFIDDPLAQTISQLGGASRVWLHHSLAKLAEAYAKAGTELVLAQGNSLEVLKKAAAHFGATRVFWNRCYDPATRQRDEHIKAQLSALQPKSFNASLLFEPWQVLKSDETPYRVYTPYWRAVAKRLPGSAPLPAPRRVPGWSTSARSRARRSTSGFGGCQLDALKLLPAQPWHTALIAHWQVGEKAAGRQLKRFLGHAANEYRDARNHPALRGTSELSPHLHFGEISPRQILHAVFKNGVGLDDLNAGVETFTKEIVWREFAYSLLYHFPYTLDQALDKRFDAFPWAANYAASLRAWQQGRTGVPIVDAGMRQLYATGWMHNRVRMVVASYLIKNLLIPWQEGERWFRDTLIDADLASNAMGWQWAAGSGADAAPFFRVFNPVLQGEKFDTEGEYVKRWVPELHAVAKKFVHKPWELPAPERALLQYPEPLVDLKASRALALAAFDKIKRR